MNATLYARFSPRPDAEECASIETQLERARAYCVASGWTVTGEHQDRELSGARADNRPGLQAALAQTCKEKGVLVVYSLSRLARNTRDAIEIANRIDKAHAQLASLNEKVDTSTAAGRLFFTIMSALAAFQREEIAERTSDAMLRHQANGRRMSSTLRLPYGWKLDPDDAARMLPCEEEIEILEVAKGLREEGKSIYAITKELNDTRRYIRGKPWHQLTLQRILSR